MTLVKTEVCVIFVLLPVPRIVSASGSLTELTFSCFGNPRGGVWGRVKARAVFCLLPLLGAGAVWTLFRTPWNCLWKLMRAFKRWMCQAST